MQFFAVLSLLAAAAIASPVANPDKTFTVSIPHVTTKTIVLPETTFTASIGSYVQTFTVPTLPTDFPKFSLPNPSFATEFKKPSLPTNFPKPSFPAELPKPSFPVGIPSLPKPTEKPSHWRFAKNE